MATLKEYFQIDFANALTFFSSWKTNDENPIDIFRRNIWVNPFWEGNVPELAGLIGDEHVMFGSDWPHPEGLAEPLGYLKYIEDVDETMRRRVMSTNAYAFLDPKAA